MDASAPRAEADDDAAALPGPPDPWAASDMPVPRGRPPFHMTEMIAAEPGLARRLLGRLADDVATGHLAAAIRETALAGGPVVATGCGTSEHGALAVADIVRGALRRAGLPVEAGTSGMVSAAQAFEAALDPPSSGLVVGVSHEGGTWATNRALEAARAAGARTALITASRRSPGAGFAEPGLVVETGELDQSWCHTVGYLSPILVATAVGARLAGETVDADAAVGALAAGLGLDAEAEAVAAELAGTRHLVVVASGADRTAGRELVLKVEEATWLPSAYRDLETMLHGHLPATDASTGLVLVLADREAREARLERATQLLRAAALVGLRTAAIVTADAAAALDPDLTPAGRLVVPETPTLPPAPAALLATATALQILTERLARARGTDPDPIRRDDARYRDAAAVVEG